MDDQTAVITEIRNIIANITTNIDNLRTFMNTSNPALTTEQKQLINARINELEQTKISLSQQLIPIFNMFGTNLEFSSDVLNSQIYTQNVLNDETEKTARQREVLQAEKPDRIRLTGINTYYSKKYNSHKQIMKTIVLICIPIIILSILGNKGLLPNTIVVLLISAIIIFGVITIGYQIIDISNRDKMDFDAYNWKFNKSNAPAPEPVGAGGDPNNPWNIDVGYCIGDACCTTGSTKWDSTTHKCIPA
jgi:hypothetical protein